MDQLSLANLKKHLLQLTSIRISAIGALNFLNLGVNIITGLLLARVLAKDTYGALIAFYASFGMFRLITNLGLGLNISRDIAQAGRDSQQVMIAVYSTGAVRLLSILIIVLAGWPVAQVSGRWGVFFGTIAAALASAADFTFAILTGTRRTSLVGIMTVIQPFGYLLLSIMALKLGNRYSAAFINLYAVSFGMMLLTGLVLIVKERILTGIKREYFKIGYLKLVIGFILASYIASLLSQLWSSLASGSLGWMGRYEDAAEFGVAFSIVNLPIAVIGPTVLTTFFPEASFLYKKLGKHEVFAYFNKTAILVIGLLSCFSLILMIFAEQIIQILYGAKYLDSAVYLRILSIVPITGSMLPFLTLGLFAVNEPWKPLIGLGLQALSLFIAILVSSANLSAIQLSIFVVVASANGVLVQYYLFRKSMSISLLAHT